MTGPEFTTQAQIDPRVPDHVTVEVTDPENDSHVLPAEDVTPYELAGDDE